ncbi:MULTISPECIES: F510_1955 family glycosylhydrolase [unclassified Leucobacter]|uniref:F510_1955 family glycosylhydrolase n=1 Tax=unclassified Leucobacter TaxID=2621730 RepID=UPI00301B56D1
MFTSRLRSSPRRALVALAAAVAAVTVLAGCGASSTPPPAAQTPVEFGHIHAVVPEAGTTILVGTHMGLYRVDAEGSVQGPLGGYDFDVMGLTLTDGALIASGHPGMNTPSELGSPNLGIIRSEDAGQNWEPVAFTSEEDFHVLTAGPDGQVYGIGSSSPALQISGDAGNTWTAGSEITAADLAVTADSTVYAATPSGLFASQDNAAAFGLVADAPTLYLLEAAGDQLVGVDTDGQLWRRSGQAAWTPIGTAEGTVAALGLAPSGVVYLVDDRGIVALDGDQATTILPAL